MKKLITITLAIVSIFLMATCKKSKENSSTPVIEPAAYTTGVSGNNYSLVYADTTGNVFLRMLRSRYNLVQVVEGATTDLQRVIKLTDWVHSKWQHDGNNSPNGQNADQVLTGASQGKRYSCVGYGICLAGCLNAIGLKSRVLGLKRKDVETANCCAGHVCMEVFLNDAQKWVLADAQFDVVPTLNNIPLNAYELRNAIANNLDALTLNGASNNKLQYTSFVAPYLYFFDFKINSSDNGNYVAAKSLILVPNGITTPVRFQINGYINGNGVLGTNYVGDFYATP
jgi:transglutaminase-like putative cysteine protease